MLTTILPHALLLATTLLGTALAVPPLKGIGSDLYVLDPENCPSHAKIETLFEYDSRVKKLFKSDTYDISPTCASVIKPTLIALRHLYLILDAIDSENKAKCRDVIYARLSHTLDKYTEVSSWSNDHFAYGMRIIASNGIDHKKDEDIDERYFSWSFDRQDYVQMGSFTSEVIHPHFLSFRSAIDTLFSRKKRRLSRIFSPKAYKSDLVTDARRALDMIGRSLVTILKDVAPKDELGNYQDALDVARKGLPKNQKKLTKHAPYPGCPENDNVMTVTEPNTRKGTREMREVYSTNDLLFTCDTLHWIH